MNVNEGKNTIITVEEIISRCPAPVISRRMAAKLSGGLVGERHLANLDVIGEGPDEKIRLGRRAGYTAESFAHWLVDHLSVR